MSTIEEVINGSSEHENAPPDLIDANTLEYCSEGSVTSGGLHKSHNSAISSDGDLSLLSLSLDKEVEGHFHAVDVDELPVFEIRLISPLGRTPSPINLEDIKTPTRPTPLRRELPTTNPCHNNPEFVALHDINAQIIPPSDSGNEDEPTLSRTYSLETIYEGVFLNTPPRQRLSLQNNRNVHSRTNLLEKVALNRLNVGKENESPSFKFERSPQCKSPGLGHETHNY